MAPQKSFPTETETQQLEQEGFSDEQIAGLLALKALYTQGIYHEDDPQRAILAGLEIIQGIRNYSEKVQKQYGMDFVGLFLN